MSALLPVAEQMLSEHRALRPFGCTLSATDQIVQVGGWSALASADDATLSALLYVEAKKADGIVVRTKNKGEFKLRPVRRSRKEGS